MIFIGHRPMGGGRNCDQTASKQWRLLHGTWSEDSAARGEERDARYEMQDASQE